MRRTRAPNIYAGKQEQPHHVDEVPVPRGEFKAEMLLRSKVAGNRAREADNQEYRANDHMGAVEAGGHEKGRAINVTAEVESSVRVFVGLHACERKAKQDGEDQAPLQSLPVVFQQRMVRPR